MKERIKLLTDTQIENIHETALHLLETHGMKFDNDEACEYFKRAGAVVDGHVCRIPRSVIESCLKTVPKREDFVLYGRTPERDWKIADHLPGLNPLIMILNVIDPYSDEVRPATRKDAAQLTQLVERCDCYADGSACVNPQDVPPCSVDWYTWAESLKHTTKHVTGGAVGKKGVYDAALMGAIALGGYIDDFKKRPFLSVFESISSPFLAERNMCDTTMASAELGIVNLISSGGMLGVSIPMTVEGALILTHAEIIAVIALTQLVKSGAPVLYASYVRSIDMRLMTIGQGSPESVLMRGCIAQMGNYLHLPTQIPTMCRDGKVLDAQAGFESGFGGIIGAMLGDFVVTNELDSNIIVDYADIPFSNECMEQLQRIMRPLDFSEERVCLENMKKIGHGGSFLNSEHTLKHFREELLIPHLFERDGYDKWVARGSKDIRQKSLERALEIIREVDGRPLLSDAQCAAIDKVADDSVH